MKLGKKCHILLFEHPHTNDHTGVHCADSSLARGSHDVTIRDTPPFSSVVVSRHCDPCVSFCGWTLVFVRRGGCHVSMTLHERACGAHVRPALSVLFVADGRAALGAAGERSPQSRLALLAADRVPTRKAHRVRPARGSQRGSQSQRETAAHRHNHPHSKGADRSSQTMHRERSSCVGAAASASSSPLRASRNVSRY